MIQYISKPFKWFFKLEAASGLVLLIAAILALFISNSDLSEIVKSDLILLNFDGAELDSGTVIEFLFAKALDIPAVILRSDFRAAGDQERGEPWNLMCSGYPRTRTISLNSMSWYQDSWRKGGGTSAILNRLYTKLSKKMEIMICQ